MQGFSIFDETKNAVPLLSAMKYYGFEVPKNGMMCCPFHKDDTPSMSVKNNYFNCFGCGAKGDVIEFVRLVFSFLKPIEAVRKLRQDFGLSEYQKPDNEALSRYREAQQIEKAFDLWEKKAFITLSTYFRDIFPKAIEKYKDDERVMSILLRNRATEEHLLDILTFGTQEEKIKIFKEYRKDVKDIEERVRAFNENRA